MKQIIIFLATLPACVLSFAQTGEGALLSLTGATALEDLDETAAERFEPFLSRPLSINLVSEPRLYSCGLFTRTQAAAIAEYRKTRGDILSVYELATLPSFDLEIAKALGNLLSFEGRAKPGYSSYAKQRTETDLLARNSLRDGNDWSYALKARTGEPDRWQASLTAKRGYGAEGNRPEVMSFSAVVHGRRNWRLLFGDFNARFGQGLLMWSGFSLSGFPSAASFARHPQGVTPAWTFSPSTALRGGAGELSLGRTVLTAFWNTGGPSGANVCWYGTFGQIGMTGLGKEGSSVDFRWSFGRLDAFGEVAADWRGNVLAGLGGVCFNPAYLARFSAALRAYPANYGASSAAAMRSSTRTSDEYGAALGADFRSFSLTLDAVRHPSKGTEQYKLICNYAPRIRDFLKLGFRAVSRFRPEDGYPWRNELRADATLTIAGKYSLKLCGHACRCVSDSWLCYTEAGYDSSLGKSGLKAYLRGTLFKVDDWTDRIYAYERDVSGSFSVPAYYGRGYSLLAMATCKLGRFSCQLRFSKTAYPGMKEPRQGKTEFKLQLGFSL